MRKNRRAYILATNAANTANAFIGLGGSLRALPRMRNGVMVALSDSRSHRWRAHRDRGAWPHVLHTLSPSGLSRSASPAVRY